MNHHHHHHHPPHHHHQMNAERVSGKKRNAVNLEKQRDVVCEMRDEAHEKAENKSDSSVRNSINTQSKSTDEILSKGLE